MPPMATTCRATRCSRPRWGRSWACACCLPARRWRQASVRAHRRLHLPHARRTRLRRLVRARRVRWDALGSCALRPGLGDRPRLRACADARTARRGARARRPHEHREPSRGSVPRACCAGARTRSLPERPNTADRLRRASPRAALAPILMLTLAYPEGGYEPFAPSAFWPARCGGYADRAALPRRPAQPPRAHRGSRRRRALCACSHRRLRDPHPYGRQRRPTWPAACRTAARRRALGRAARAAVGAHSRAALLAARHAHPRLQLDRLRSLCPRLLLRPAARQS